MLVQDLATDAPLVDAIVCWGRVVLGLSWGLSLGRHGALLWAWPLYVGFILGPILSALGGPIGSHLGHGRCGHPGAL
eukprot:6345649-Pyramimonas_sp.AAC.1